jgi:hypothetical protein
VPHSILCIGAQVHEHLVHLGGIGQDSASLVGYVSVELDRGRERGSQAGQGFLE